MAILKKKNDSHDDAWKPDVDVEPVVAPKVVTCKTPIDGKPCGKPLAIGQSEVCQDHVRAG